MKLLIVCLFAFAHFPFAASRPAEDEATIAPSYLTPSVDQRNLRGANVLDNESDSPYVDSVVGSARRHILQARTTLINVDVDDLTPEHIIFFEDTWVRAFNKVFFGADSRIHGSDFDDDSFPRLRSFVVEEVLSNQHVRQRALKHGRGGSRVRDIKSIKWFDISAVAETSCRFCGKDDDRRLILNRSLKKDKSILRYLETELCEGLHQGPFTCFQDLEECFVVYDEE